MLSLLCRFAKGIPLEFKQLKTFICVAECGSISRASERLRIAQPALSRQIKLLEHTVGAELFSRHARGMVLTEAGQALLERISGPLHQLEQSVLDVKSLQAEISGEVKLGILPTVPDGFTIRLFEYLNVEFPGISLHVKEAYSINLIEWLQSGEIDLCFLYGPARAYQFQSIDIVTDEIVLFSPPGILDPGKSIHVQDLAGLPLAMPNRPFGPRLIVDKLAGAAGVQLTPKFAVDSFGIAVAMAVAGLSHGIMPVSSVSALEAEGKLELRRILPGPAERQLILSHSSMRPQTRATNAVQDAVRNVLSAMCADGSWRTSLDAG